MELSQQDTVFKYLYDSGPGPIGRRQMDTSLTILERNVATIMWELERDGLIEKAGGKRGSYYYNLTPRGRAECERRFRVHAKAVQGSDLLPAKMQNDFEETRKLFEHMEEYRKLSAFVQFVVLEFELGEELNRPGATLLEVLDRAAKKYLGVNPDKLREEKS